MIVGIDTDRGLLVGAVVAAGSGAFDLILQAEGTKSRDRMHFTLGRMDELKSSAQLKSLGGPFALEGRPMAGT